MSKKEYPQDSIKPFWIKVETRDLTMSFATTLDPKKDITYICTDYCFDTPEEKAKSYWVDGFELTDWFYSTVKKMKELEKSGKMFVFEIHAYPHDKYHYCEKETVQLENSHLCTEHCKESEDEVDQDK